jgi:hypothetical protein
MWLRLVPVHHRRKVVLQRQVPALTLPAEGLDGHSQVPLETDRVHDMPAIETESRLLLGEDHLRHARVRATEFLVATALRLVESVRATEIVFRSRPADCRKLLVPVDVELDFAFAPPAGTVGAPSHVGPDVLAPALDAFDECVNIFVGQRVHASELRVEIGHLVGHMCQRVIDLVVEDHRLLVEVGHRDLTPFAEGHRPVAVEAALGIDANRQRCHLGVLAHAAREEVAGRTFHRWRLFPIPVDSENI